MSSRQLYNVGDRVRVADEPYKGCNFICRIRIDRYCGKEAEVREARYDKTYKKWGYRLSFGIDEPLYIWCEECLMPECEHEIAEVSNDELRAIL